MFRRMILVLAGIAVLLIPGSAAVLASPVRPAVHAAIRAGEAPPECVRVKMLNADGSHWWALFCGTGSRGEAPIEDEGTVPRSLIVDGSSLHSAGDCGSYVNPCVFQWAASPSS